MSTMQIPGSFHDYTVGLIVALPLERAALEIMLDDEYEEPPDIKKPSSDTNSYSFGRIHQHNVVIASLPYGIYGTVTASKTALQVIHTFPNIKFGLMIGIGAGIPRPTGPDIRLGDIVISKPGANHGGVVQHDFKKERPGDRWEPTGHLNNPPDILLRALGQMEAKCIRGKSRIPDFLKESLARVPEDIRFRFAHPGFEKDRLFESSGVHGHVNYSDPKIVHRKQRVSTNPVVHYGLIASGNTLVRDAKFRDDIFQKLGQECLCLEMEAGGLMNDFPCLVIRGICGKS
jgi:nucleoside phosphorylase